jgi:hypothetical protein
MHQATARNVGSAMTFKDAFRSWRRDVKARMPYVRRREYRILQRRYDDLIDSLGWTAQPAARARSRVLKPVEPPPSGEVCFFVSHAAQPMLKPHVRVHVEHLLRSGVHVILILNSDLDADRIEIQPSFAHRLSGLLVRENVGFDFAAWAHAYALCTLAKQWSRLILVNDSIVGPLNIADFDSLMKRLRQSNADVVSLTENRFPPRHLQSFFLALNASALRTEVVPQLFGRILNLPTKDQVIEVYEKRLTGVLTGRGLRCESLFAPLTEDLHSANDLSFRWAELIRAGFPYIKASVLECLRDHPDVRALVPAEFLGAAD